MGTEDQQGDREGGSLVKSDRLQPQALGGLHCGGLGGLAPCGAGGTGRAALRLYPVYLQLPGPPSVRCLCASALRAPSQREGEGGSRVVGTLGEAGAS